MQSISFLSNLVVSTRSRLRCWQLIPVVVIALTLSASAGKLTYTETFDDGNDEGDWHLTVNPPTLETDGGNPGAYLRASADAAVPTWYVPLNTPTKFFLGDFAANRIATLSVDLNIFSGVEVPDRAVTLDLNTTLGTGDFTKGVDAYYVGRNISQLPTGWHTYAFPVNATSTTIPPGWVVTKGDGSPGTDADWQALMHDVETLGVELGEPGFFYPFGLWDIGLDNCRVSRLSR
jgi:hypothetical protein